MSLFSVSTLCKCVWIAISLKMNQLQELHEDWAAEEGSNFWLMLWINLTSVQFTPTWLDWVDLTSWLLPGDSVPVSWPVRSEFVKPHGLAVWYIQCCGPSCEPRTLLNVACTGPVVPGLKPEGPMRWMNESRTGHSGRAATDDVYSCRPMH